MNTTETVSSQTIRQAVIERLALLSLDKQEAVLAFAEEMGRPEPKPSRFRALFENAARNVPPEAYDEIPADASSDIEQLARSETTGARLWDMIQECVKDVPPEAWEEVPTDGGPNHDHYLYGSPKRYNHDGSLIER